jgi:hypothetical protein
MARREGSGGVNRTRRARSNRGRQIAVLSAAGDAIALGIDKPDIRTVIHYDLPASLDVSYVSSWPADPTADDFTTLIGEAKALRQWEAVEGRRRVLAA